MAVDYMVWNITKDGVRVRMAAKDEEVWPSPALKAKRPPDTLASVPFSKFTLSGWDHMPDIVLPIYKEINDNYGTEFEPFFIQMQKRNR